MGNLRIFLHARHLLAAGLIALALAMKVVIPAGYMLNQAGAGPLLMVCPKANPGFNLEQQQPAPAAHHGHHAAHHTGHASHNMSAMPDMAHDDGDAHQAHKSDNTCPYSVMPMASLSGADGVQLAIALGFILALGFASVTVLRLVPIPYLRPPLRGPPQLLG